MSEKDFTVYEASFLLNPNLTADEANDFATSLRSKAEALGGEYISHEAPKELVLQYEMSREINNKKTWFSNAIFGWVKFKLEAKDVAEIEKSLKSDEKVIRYLLVKTVAENTIYGNKISAPKKRRDKKDKDGDEPVDMNEEEVDKKIDELVAEA